MGMFLQNIAIKSTDKDSVIKIIKEKEKVVYIADSKTYWILVFPNDSRSLDKFAQELSQKLNTLVTAGLVYDSDDFIFNIFENGDKIFEFNVDRINGEGLNLKVGTIDTLKKLTTEVDNSKAVKALESNKPGEYTFVEDRYQDILSYLAMPVALGWISYDYIINADKQPELKQNIEKSISNLELIH